MTEFIESTKFQTHCNIRLTQTSKERFLNKTVMMRNCSILISQNSQLPVNFYRSSIEEMISGLNATPLNHVRTVHL